MKTINDIIAQSVAINRQEGLKNDRVDKSRNKFFFGGFITVMTGLLFTLFIAITTSNNHQIEQVVKKPADLIISRDKWLDDLGRVGSRPLKTPVKKVIVFETNVTEFCELDSCSSNILKGNFYPYFEDVKENFVIGTEGIVFEGRGFLREGQMLFDEFGTSYDNDAISENKLMKIHIQFSK